MKSFTFQKFVGLTAALSGLLVAMPIAAHAQTGGFGSVDVDKVAQNAKETAKNQDTMKALVTKLQNIYNKMTAPTASALYLTDSQFNELAGLYQKDTTSDAEKKRITELETAGDTLQGEYNRLASTKTQTPDEVKRFSDLKDKQTAGQQNATALGQTFQQEMKERDGALSLDLLKDIRAAIADVAKAKSLSIVFPSTVALYTANDITTDVISKINK